MNDKSRVIQKRLITGLLSLAFMMSLVLTPASAAGSTEQRLPLLFCKM